MTLTDLTTRTAHPLFICSPKKLQMDLFGVTAGADIDEMKQLALTRENSATIGFVVSCIFAGAIDKRELQAWADHVLVSADSYPLYIVDLRDIR